ncbi:MAG: Na/Pi cotransporter family protein [Lachnospiraceae bacterium]|nr:Na/Pi cotransporter family protein [Lachnospiraceae bacterium]
MEAITIALKIFSGVALFLFGMSLMGDGLQRVAGKSLERTLYKLTSTPLKGVLLGTVVTAVIQSSSATTVMVVGFVNSGMMKVAQAIGVIMGANIGTSITGWILCLSYIEGSNGIATLLSTATISAVVAIIGIILKKFTKRSVYHNVGDIMLGFAILMVGMQTMSGAVAPLKENAGFVSLLTMFTNPVVGILVGIAITAVLQSASASVGILQALSMTGAITFASAFPITLGIGIGAAVPVLLSAIGTNNNGKRTALVYLLNDLLGMIIWGTVFYTANAFVHFEFMDMTMAPVKIALLNTVYRMLTVFALFPFVSAIESMVFKLVKDSEEDIAEQADFDLLDERFLAYPELAISQAGKAMEGMANTAKDNLTTAFSMMSEYSDDIWAKVEKKEKLLDKYEDKLGEYIMLASKKSLNTSEITKTSKYLHVITDFERLGDHALNIAYIARQIQEEKLDLSESAMKEIQIMSEAIKDMVAITVEAFETNDIGKAHKVEPACEFIRDLCDRMKTNHVMRLQKELCAVENGMVFNDLLNNFDRIAAHCSNIGIAVVETMDNAVEAHDYKHEYKKNNSEAYAKDYDVFADRYKISQFEYKKDKKHKDSDSKKKDKKSEDKKKDKKSKDKKDKKDKKK